MGSADRARPDIRRRAFVLDLGLMSAVDTMYAVALLIAVAIVAGAYQYRR